MSETWGSTPVQEDEVNPTPPAEEFEMPKNDQIVLIRLPGGRGVKVAQYHNGEFLGDIAGAYSQLLPGEPDAWMEIPEEWEHEKPKGEQGV